MTKPIIDRIARAAGHPDLARVLAEDLSGSDIHSLLLEVFRRRAADVTPADLLQAYATNRFVRPSAVPPRVFAKLDALALSLLPAGFEELELSPLAPFATCAAVAPVNQNNIVSATRQTEVVADATNLLALEAALRRRALLLSDPHAAARVRLAASHRHVRAQSLTDPRFTAHFRILCLVTAGRDQGSLRFEIEGLREHIAFHLDVLNRWTGQHGGVRPTVVRLTARCAAHEGALQREVLDALAPSYESTTFLLDRARLAAARYYDGICFNIGLKDAAGVDYAYTVDGGLTDWTRKLLSNKKERLLTSALGSELLCKILGLATEA
jgi:hypothetical protein